MYIYLTSFHKMSEKLLLLLHPCPPQLSTALLGSHLGALICVLGETAWQWTVLAQAAVEIPASPLSCHEVLPMLFNLAKPLSPPWLSGHSSSTCHYED